MDQQIAAVNWTDAWHSTGVFTQKEIDNESAYTVTTIGVVVRRDETGIYIAAERINNGNFRHVHHIPSKMINRVDILVAAPPEEFPGV